MEKGKKEIIISEELYERLEKMAKNLGFEDIHEYVTFVLEEMVKNEGEGERELSEEEKKQVKDGLKKLGYT